MDEKDEQYSDEEIRERMARGLKRALSTPPKPQRPPKGKRGRPRKRVLKPRHATR